MKRPPVQWKRDGYLAVAAYVALLVLALAVIYIGAEVIAWALRSATSV